MYQTSIYARMKDRIVEWIVRCCDYFLYGLAACDSNGMELECGRINGDEFLSSTNRVLVPISNSAA